jgi:hypothetical protein
MPKPDAPLDRGQVRVLVEGRLLPEAVSIAALHESCDNVLRTDWEIATTAGFLRRFSTEIAYTDVPDSACLNANAICSSEKCFFPIRKTQPFW